MDGRRRTHSCFQCLELLSLLFSSYGRRRKEKEGGECAMGVSYTKAIHVICVAFRLVCSSPYSTKRRHTSSDTLRSDHRELRLICSAAIVSRSSLHLMLGKYATFLPYATLCHPNPCNTKRRSLKPISEPGSPDLFRMFPTTHSSEPHRCRKEPGQV
jgi:hypothetical protein